MEQSAGEFLFIQSPLSHQHLVVGRVQAGTHFTLPRDLHLEGSLLYRAYESAWFYFSSVFHLLHFLGTCMQELRDIATVETIKGKHFFLESDLKGEVLKLDHTGKAILTVSGLEWLPCWPSYVMLFAIHHIAPSTNLYYKRSERQPIIWLYNL